MSNVQRPTLNSPGQDPRIPSVPLDVRCSMFDVRRFRGDLLLWMKFFLQYWLPLVAWLGLMFVGSTNVMSSEHTSGYIVPYLLWLKPGMSPKTIWIILVVVRKCAHVTEYAILALLLWRALRSVPVLCTKTSILFGAVLLGCAIFAASDEFHQTFIKSRTPSVRDVFLDVAGALVGLLIGASFTHRVSLKSRRTARTRIMDAQS
jgi:VanZ like family